MLCEEVESRVLAAHDFAEMVRAAEFTSFGQLCQIVWRIVKQHAVLDAWHILDVSHRQQVSCAVCIGQRIISPYCPMVHTVTTISRHIACFNGLGCTTISSIFNRINRFGCHQDSPANHGTVAQAAAEFLRCFRIVCAGCLDAIADRPRCCGRSLRGTFSTAYLHLGNLLARSLVVAVFCLLASLVVVARLARHAARHALRNGPDEACRTTNDASCLVHRLADFFLPFFTLAVIADALLQFICRLLQSLLHSQWRLFWIPDIAHTKRPLLSLYLSWYL